MIYSFLKNKYLAKNKILSIKHFSNQIIPAVFSQMFYNELVYIVHRKNILLSLTCLKNHIKFQYKVLSCISGVDFLNTNIGKTFRFGVVYDLLSINFKTRVRVKVFVNEISKISSSIVVFTNANWWEREIWDMYGIWFEKHTDLRRILTDYGFDGFPLRKDFPLSGFIDVCYDSSRQGVISRPLELAQEFRVFTVDNNW
jgi:NADH/F420H2 dehydrogenase subunit C